MVCLVLPWFLKLDWPPTFPIKSCGLQTEFLASNSGNGVNVKSLLPCLKLNAHQLLRLRPKTQLRGQLFMRWVRGQSNSISHLYSWCAFSLMHKIKGRRVYSPFAELEAKISVWRPLQRSEASQIPSAIFLDGLSSIPNHLKAKKSVQYVGGIIFWKFDKKYT